MWVLIHVGFAVARIDEDEARVTLDLFRQMGEIEAELELMSGTAPG
jgi:hydrogenase expression/formation protein HypC